MFSFLFRRKSSDKGSSSDRKKGDSRTQCSDVSKDTENKPSGSSLTVEHNLDNSSSDERYSVAASCVSLNESLPNSMRDGLEFIDIDANGEDSTGSSVGLNSTLVANPENKTLDGVCGVQNTAELKEFQSKVLEKEEEIRLLKLDIQMYSKERDDKSFENESLLCQLRKLREENESCSTARRKIEKQIDDLRLKNNQLTQELIEKTESLKSLERDANSNRKRIAEAQERIRDLERQLAEVRKEKTELISEHEAIEVERDEEMRALQNGLDGALEQRIKLQHKMDAEFKALRNSFLSQEQQLIDDFEWKLRQIESSCKSKLRDKDNETEEKLAEAKSKLQGEMAVEWEKLNQERRTVEEQMRLVCHYKAYEAELLQLRGLTHEQQRALRSAARQLEHFKFNEKVLHEEVHSARKQIEKEKSNSIAAQSTLHAKMEVQTKNLTLKLEQQKNELNSKWETRVEAECSRLKQDLAKVHADEKHHAVEYIKSQKTQEFAAAKQTWMKEMQHLQEKISQLTETIREMESTSKCQLDKITTTKDKEILDLRAKLERMYLNKESLDTLKSDHAKEIALLRAKYEASQKVVDERTAQEIASKTAFAVVNTTSIPSPINQSDSGCGDEGSSEESEYDMDEAESESPEKVVDVPMRSSIESDGSVDDAVVHHLRVEVASLQGSIEQLTTNLVVEEGKENVEESDDGGDSEQ